MDINFGALSFHVNGSGDVSLVKFWSVDNRDMIEQDIAFKVPIIDLAGGDTSGRRRLAVSDAAQRLKYVSHRQEETRLILIQENESVRVTSVYQAYDDTNAVRVTQQITNITDEPICLELARLLSGFAAPPLIVFVTAHEDFAVQAFDLKAVEDRKSTRLNSSH